MSNDKPLVGIILGSKSDAPDFEGCKEMLEKFGVPYEFVIHSAHRNPDDVREWAVSAESRGLRVIIAGAGKAAALGGVDSLLSTVQMPTGVPLACVAINGTKNAAILATQILGTAIPEYRDAIVAYKRELAGA